MESKSSGLMREPAVKREHSKSSLSNEITIIPAKKWYKK